MLFWLILPLSSFLQPFQNLNDIVWTFPVGGCCIHFLMTLQDWGMDCFQDSELSAKIRAEARVDMEKLVGSADIKDTETTSKLGLHRKIA